MSPLRLLILAGLFYLLWRLLRGPRRTPPRTAGPHADAPPPVADDVLVEDPVCHVHIPRKQAVRLQEGGRTVYFCSPECRNRYRSAGKQDNGTHRDQEGDLP